MKNSVSLNEISEHDNSINENITYRNLQIEEDKIFNYANQVPLVQKISIKPKNVAKELYEMILPGIDKTYDLICKNNDPKTNLEIPYNLLTFNIADPVSTIRAQLENFLNERIVMRKIEVNLKNEYISGSESDASYSAQRPFSTFYISKQFNYVNSTSDKISLLFFVDNSIDKQTSFNTDCTISPKEKQKDSKNYNLNLIQTHSNKLDGYFVLKIIDDYNNVYKTDNIQCFTYNLEEYLNRISYLNNKVQVLKTNIGLELIEFIIRINLSVKILRNFIIYIYWIKLK